MDSDIAIVDLFFLILDLALEFVDELQGVAGGLFLLVFIHEIVVFLFAEVLLRLNHGKS